jgi:hypothetical protein
MTYSIDSDIRSKFSHLTIPSGILVGNFREAAYNRVNAKLRKIYEVPITSIDITDQAVLKEIESNIAAGKIIMSVSTSDELTDIHQYGESLVKEGEFNIKELLKEDMVLSSLATRDADDSDETIDPPKILGSSADEHSTFDRPMSGIENDAIEGKVDAEEYSELNDTKTI